ncbi:hypothetical protein FA13DRAFT_1807491 [Coprinellus micaceus]|uniref:Uncharacterized protein n=1 Tax=Coprinellus micaceus TaxID=71717 RepID=A0A4Y7R8S0_COPMI|nr:hypothetical protein FA13DRAFT_1807491 [Coprinellus micaceus]
MTEVSAAASNPEAPSTTASRRHRFGFSEVANLFIRLRRHQSRASLASQARKETEDPAAAPQEATPPPDTDNVQAIPGPHPIDSSGRLILTPPLNPTRSRVRRLTGELVRSPYARRTSNLKPKPHHLISSSGNTPITQPSIRESTLAEGPHIPITYNDVFEVAVVRSWDHREKGLGANALADEQWECIICGPKKQAYKVQINYSATAVWCTRPDVCKPVALDRAQSFPGLMSITKRNAL